MSLISENTKGKGKERRSYPPGEYTVGWIAALADTERVAAEAMLDEVHAPLRVQAKHDENNYTLGGIGEHKVVIACLPEYGKSILFCFTYRSSPGQDVDWK